MCIRDREIGLHLIRMFFEMLFQYIIYIVAYRQLPFTGNPYKMCIRDSR